MIIHYDQDTGVPTRIIARRPDNGHNHYRHRGDPRFKPTVAYIARQFARSNAMGNVEPPILTAPQMVAYRRDIKEAAAEAGFPDHEPLMVLMASPDTTGRMAEEAYDAGAYGIKVMPANGTTNSSHGLGEDDYGRGNFRDCLRVTRERGKTVLLHAELPFQNGLALPMAVRSRAFIPIYEDMRSFMPDVRICIEHVDIREYVAMTIADPFTCATVTLHHMDATHADADADVHLQCMPYPKSPEDVEAVRRAVMELRHPRFFYGSDNAPHLRPMKVRNDGKPPASGVFSAPVELADLAGQFERFDRLIAFERFTSEFFARWHGLPLNEGTVTLERRPWRVPDVIRLPGGDEIVPYRHGQVLNWQLST